ncbi:MAG TPA: ABC transporter permease, partial [Anaerolineales bacterium]|nr:ABC transporter permease [Anaerolineales bacterium]
PPVLLAGRWFTQAEEDETAYVAVLGNELANRLAGERNIVIDQLVGQEWNTYTIIGIMEDWPALHSMGYSSDVAYAPVDAIYPSAEEYPLVGQIPFQIPEGLDFEATLEQLRQTLREHKSSWLDEPESEPQVVLPAVQLADLIVWRKRFHLVLGLFAAVSFFVGSVGAMNYIFVWVVSRWREIGIRRAVGADVRAIFRLVISQSLSLNLICALLGSVVGTVVGLLVQFNQDWPLTFHPYWIAVAVGSGLMATFLFGSLPASWAARCPPIESLRME